jgi:hypothetical protein
LLAEKCGCYFGHTVFPEGQIMAKKTDMPAAAANNFPKLHNAMWPGLVGKGSPGAEPCIDLDTMLDMTAKAEVNGVKFDGVDIFLFEPHVNIDSSDDDLKRLAGKSSAERVSLSGPSSRRFGRRPAVARPWAATKDRAKFVEQVRKGCRIAKKLRELGVSVPYGSVRIDFSRAGVSDWEKRIRRATPRKIAKTFKEAAKVGEGPWRAPCRLKARFAGAACTVGRQMLDLLEESRDQPEACRFSGGHGAHASLLLGYNEPKAPHRAGEISLGAGSLSRRDEEDDQGTAPVDD